MRNVTAALLMSYIFLTFISVVTALSGVHLGSWLTPLNTLIGFSFSILHASQRYGWKVASILLVCVFVISLGMESVGVATGLVYGPYHYTDQLGIKFLGLVPLLIPIAWFMMMYPATVIAERLVIPGGKGKILSKLAVAAIAGIVMTAWDVAMDPMMVLAGHWVWEVDGAFFGVPVHNFIGWWLTTFLSVAVFLLLTMGMKRPVESAPERWAVLSYTNQAAATIIMDFSFGLGGAGMAGFFAMMPWIIMGWIGKQGKGGQDAGKD